MNRAAVGLAELGVSTIDAVVSLLVYIVVPDLTITGPVLYFLVGGAHVKPSSTRLRAGSRRTTRQ
jgi:hypothetical protein